MIKCPLCKSPKTVTIDQFLVSQLMRIVPQKYRRILHEDIGDLDVYKVIQCENCHLFFFHPIVPGSDRFYEALSDESFYYMEEKPEYSLIQSYLPKPLRLLEIGCGAGHFAEKIHPPAEKYRGLDLNLKAIASARSRGFEISSERIESFSNSHAEEYNAVGSFHVLEHVADAHSFVLAGLACLEHGGTYFFAVPNQDSFVGRASNEFLNLPPHHMTRWPKATLEMFPKIFALKLVAIIEEDLADYHMAFYVRTCHGIGREKEKMQANRFVYHAAHQRGLISRLYNKLCLNPILKNIVSGMGEFRPHLAGQSLIGVYVKQ